jgi:hypothetical protein
MYGSHIHMHKPGRGAFFAEALVQDAVIRIFEVIGK